MSDGNTDKKKKYLKNYCYKRKKNVELSNQLY